MPKGNITHDTSTVNLALVQYTHTAQEPGSLNWWNNQIGALCTNEKLALSDHRCLESCVDR